MVSLLPPDGTVQEDVVDRLFCFFAIAECRVHDASWLQVRLQATVSLSKPEYSGLLMPCQTVDWVCSSYDQYILADVAACEVE